MNTLRPLSLLASLVFLGACLTFPPGQDGNGTADAAVADAQVNDAGCSDSDGDGYLAAGCPSALPADCDDGDENRNPGARELCGNSIDENCDGGDEPSGCVDPLATNDVDGYRVQSAFNAIVFDPLHGLMITELTVPSVSGNLLHASGDMLEKWIGVHMWPSDFQHTPMTTPSDRAVANGPAVFRLRIASSTGATGFLAQSHYTVFPDGRIHRDDEISVPTTQTSRWLTGFVALDPSQFTHADCGYNPGPYALGPLGSPCAGTSAILDGYSCAYHASNDIAVGLLHRIPGTPTPNGPRVQESQMGDADTRSVALIFDWYQSEDVIMGDYRGDFVIYAGASDPAPNQCAALGRLQSWLHNPATIVPGGGASMHAGTTADGDDDSDGWYEGGGFWALDAGAASEIAFSIDTNGGASSPPARPAFRLHGLALDRGSGKGYLPVVDINGVPQVHGRDYLWQMEADETVPTNKVGWIYFAKALADSDNVRIRVPSALQ